MSVALLIMLGSVVATLGWAVIPWSNREQRAWERIARALGLIVEQGDLRFPGRLSGVIDGYPVHLESNGEGVVVCVRSKGEAPPQLSIRFHRGVPEIDGPEELALAVLTPAAKAALERVGLGIVESGEIRCFLENKSPEVVIAAVKELVHLCSALSFQKMSLDARLLAAMELEPLVPRKRRMLELLLDIEGSSRERAIALSLISPDARTRLIAARARAAAEGAQVLRALVDDRSVEDEVRAAALAALPRAIELDELIELITGAGPNLRVAIAASLAREGEPRARAEHVLLALLEDREIEVRIAAAESLGKIGTVVAVEKLLEAGESFFLGGRLTIAAKEAVRSIQARKGVGSRGHLSIAAAESDGTLALADEARGAVSVSDD